MEGFDRELDGAYVFSRAPKLAAEIHRLHLHSVFTYNTFLAISLLLFVQELLLIV